MGFVLSLHGFCTVSTKAMYKRYIGYVLTVQQRCTILVFVIYGFEIKIFILFADNKNNAYLCIREYKMTIMSATITREEALRRLKSNRERKQKCLEEMREFLRTRYVERTGEEPKNFFAL